MVVSCCAYACTERFEKGCPITFHSFPKEEHRRKLWENQLRRKNFTANNNTRICSKHFEEDCFKISGDGKRRLKFDALPTRFDFPNYLKKNVNPRKRRAEIGEYSTATNVSTRQKKLRYVGDFDESDVESPTRARKLLSIARKNIKTFKKSLRKLRDKNNSLVKKICSLEEIINKMKGKALISDSAGSILKVGYCLKMDSTQDSVLSSIIFEHACKQEYKGVLRNMLEDKDVVSKVLENSTSLEQNSQKKPKIQPVFMLISLLRKLHSLENFSKISKNSSKLDILPVIIELLETAYRQCHFISLKKFFTFISELKLLDLLNLIVDSSESSQVVQKLNQHFPRWTATYKSNLEKNFNIENTKVLDKVEESHTQCRRLILKLAMDKSYKTKYMTEQYCNDMNRLMQESKVYILEVITALESQSGCSVLEKMLSGDEMEGFDSNDLGVQLLLDYVQPSITDEALLRFLDDFEPILNSQPATALSSCLLPIDTMSEVSDDENYEDSDQSESDYENSQDTGDHVKSFADALPSVSMNDSPKVPMDLDEKH